MTFFFNLNEKNVWILSIAGTCEIKEISSIEGEASANNRKAKLIFFYEFEIKGEWSGEHSILVSQILTILTHVCLYSNV